MQQPTVVSEGSDDRSVGRLVVKNTLYLTIAQALTIPLSVITNAAMGRYLGAEDFGYIYLAATLVGFGFVVVDWGHSGALPSLIATDRSRSGAMLGTSLAWRNASCLIVYGALAVIAHLLGYDAGLQLALALTTVSWLLNSMVAACKDTIRGFERTDIPSYVHVAQQLLGAILCVVVLALGGGMVGALLAGCVSALAMFWPIARTLKPIGVTKLSIERSALRSLFGEGTPFVFFGVAMVLVPNIDAVYLSKLAPPEVMGWYAASRRLIGMLLLPSTALIGALYPTLCRLWATDKAAFNATTSGSLRATSLLVVPAAVGCGLYPDVGIAIFSREAFGPAEDNLRILAVFLLLVYFSMPIGTALLAAGQRRAWSAVQAVCVLTSLVLDPILVPWFQRRIGNGGAGLCVTGVVAELIVVGAGLALMPKGVFDRRLGRLVLLSTLSGVVMAGVALLTRPLIGPFASAPVAVLAYGASLWLTKALEQEQIDALRGFVGRAVSKFKRRSA
jgi:O-antigen/teichoic acid export membrane protein